MAQRPPLPQLMLLIARYQTRNLFAESEAMTLML